MILFNDDIHLQEFLIGNEKFLQVNIWKPRILVNIYRKHKYIFLLFY